MSSSEVDVQSLKVEFDLLTLDTEAYKAELINFFKNYTQNPRTTNPDECILNSLNYFSSCLRDLERAHMYTEVVFSAFEIFRYTNWDVIRSMLEFYVAVRLALENRVSFSKVDPPSPPKLLPKNNIDYKQISGHVKKISVDSFFYEVCTLIDFTATKAMLRYGVRFAVEEFEMQKYLYRMLRALLNGLTEYNPECNHKREELITLVNVHYPTIKDLRRLYFILLAIHSVILKEINKEGTLEILNLSLDLVFEAIPDPWISLPECTRFLNIVMKDVKRKKKKIREFCDKFRRAALLFASVHLSPRSLKHLSRCQVREWLLKSKALPHGIWKEGLPRELSNYVLLQEDEDEDAFYLDLGYKLK